ncbi:MAG TPA: hypothetical protein DEP36_17065 [Gammaproteobacteria bacterium]|nr:hypothetical protein [Gammaproteobacteria bacterium]HRF42844.1 hypothetical protein [Candidatus Competibacteraceae bacterium]
MNRFSRQFLVFVLIGFWCSPIVLAELPLGSKTFSLSGFGTLGGPYNFDDEAGFIRDISQPKGARGNGVDWAIDSRLGLQGTWKPREDFSSTLQLVSKYRYDGSYRPEVTWAFLKYAINPNVQVRAGRLGTDIYLQADSRDVGYAYLWVRPPVDYFGQLFNSYIDGLDLTATRGFGDGVLRGKLYAGQLHETLPGAKGSEYSLNGSTAVGGHLEYQHLHWLFRVGYAAVRLENEGSIEPLLNALRSTGVPQAVTLAQEMSSAGKHFDIFSAGVAYDNGPLQSQLMMSHLSSELAMSSNNTAGYLSIGYRIGPWTPYLVYSRIKSKDPQYTTGLPNSLPFEAINAGVAQAFSFNQVNQETFSLGVRYDFAQNADFKLQLDWIDSRDNPSILWVDPEPDWDGQAAVLSATFDFVF